LDIWYLAVKMADRIHNLRTMEGDGIHTIKRKLAETKKYFWIPEIEERIPVAYHIIAAKVYEIEKDISNARLEKHYKK
jgi:(p)ppGpp synthase/HD superfamily hydrolase